MQATPLMPRKCAPKTLGNRSFFPCLSFPRQQSGASFSLPTLGEMGAAWALLFPLALGFLSAQHFREDGPCRS